MSNLLLVFVLHKFVLLRWEAPYHVSSSETLKKWPRYSDITDLAIERDFRYGISEAEKIILIQTETVFRVDPNNNLFG